MLVCRIWSVPVHEWQMQRGSGATERERIDRGAIAIALIGTHFCREQWSSGCCGRCLGHGPAAWRRGCWAARWAAPPPAWAAAGWWSMAARRSRPSRGWSLAGCLCLREDKKIRCDYWALNELLRAARRGQKTRWTQRSIESLKPETKTKNWLRCGD